MRQDRGVLSTADLLDELQGATRALFADVDGMTEHMAREPSLLPDWSRAHVLAHLARNAEGSTRLLRSVLTGEDDQEYASVAAREREIGMTARLPVAELRALVAEHAAGLARACVAMPPESWSRPVTWTTGHSTPAREVPRSRLIEVLVHHVDLALGYRPSDWPGDFVRRRLVSVTASLNRRGLAPGSFRLEATNTDQVVELIAPAETVTVVRGEDHALLAWLLGRSNGTELQTRGQAGLPKIPSTYTT